MGLFHSRQRTQQPIDGVTVTHDYGSIADTDHFINMKEFEDSVISNTGLRPNWMQWKLFVDCASKHQDFVIPHELKISKIDYMIHFDDTEYDDFTRKTR